MTKNTHSKNSVYGKAWAAGYNGGDKVKTWSAERLAAYRAGAAARWSDSIPWGIGNSTGGNGGK